MKPIFTLCCFTIIALNLFIAPSTAATCKSIHVGTDTKSNTISDIIADGETSKLWKEDSSSPVIVTHAKKLEYFYMVDMDVEIDKSNIHLSHDNPDYAKSYVTVKKEPKKRWYTLEVLYNCEAYGGALLNYEIKIDIPNCGTAKFHWKKVCGYPQTPRAGMRLDVYSTLPKATLVKNGLPHLESYYDKEVEDFSFEVPKNCDNITLEIYMNKEDIDFKKLAEQYQADHPKLATLVANGTSNETNGTTNSTDPAADFDTILKNVTSSILTDLDTKVGPPKIDSDDAVAAVKMEGALVGKGGVISEQKQNITVSFTCEKVTDFSTVEFIIPLTNFRDIHIYFYKECEYAGSVSDAVSNADGHSILFWFLLLALVYVLYLTYTNIAMGKRGLDIIPYVSESKGFFNWLLDSSNQASKRSANKNKGNSNVQKRRDDDDANQFNIKNISEIDDEYDDTKYGTI